MEYIQSLISETYDYSLPSPPNTQCTCTLGLTKITNSMLLQAKEIIPIQLLTVHAQVICDMLDCAEEWSKEAQLIQDSDTTPHFDQLKSMLASGRSISVKLELLAQLESRFAAAKGWVDRAARTFLKKTSNNSVLDVR